ncbi:hypothetical protein L2E82_17158 [Cichorium intybus]|uniref:Uncharacterized protein n=1 Tax=Cichorium intybus TaxID=13427 RepID=A0ACB9F862_CICIN|nr:hypothetical protein L2E82_17158 [Cichorium intybus]
MDKCTCKVGHIGCDPQLYFHEIPISTFQKLGRIRLLIASDALWFCLGRPYSPLSTRRLIICATSGQPLKLFTYRSDCCSFSEEFVRIIFLKNFNFRDFLMHVCVICRLHNAEALNC